MKNDVVFSENSQQQDSQYMKNRYEPDVKTSGENFTFLIVLLVIFLIAYLLFNEFVFVPAT